MLVGINGTVFDMASHPTGPSFYGPGNSYNGFCGRDATLMFARMIVDPSAPIGAPEMSNMERDTMMEWVGSMHRAAHAATTWRERDTGEGFRERSYRHCMRCVVSPVWLWVASSTVWKRSTPLSAT